MRTAARGQRAVCVSTSSLRALPAVLGLVALCVLAGCKEDRLHAQTGALEASVGRLDFTERYPGQTAEQSFDVFSGGRIALQAEVTLSPAVGKDVEVGE